MNTCMYGMYMGKVQQLAIVNETTRTIKTTGTTYSVYIYIILSSAVQ